METARPTPRREYQRLLAAGVNPETAQLLAGRLYAMYRERRLAKIRSARRGRRRKPCPECGRPVQAYNFARHCRTHERQPVRSAA